MDTKHYGSIWKYLFNNINNNKEKEVIMSDLHNTIIIAYFLYIMLYMIIKWTINFT